MKIVTVGYLHGAGGAERQIILLSNQLAQRGHDVSFVILSENKSHYTIDTSVNIVDLSNVENGHFRILRRLHAFRKTIYNIKPDIIINYNIQSAYFCLTIPRLIRGKIIYSERNDPYDRQYSGLLGIVRDITIRSVDGIVFQTEGARDFFPEHVKKKSIVIPNSVNIKPIEQIKAENREKRIINIGRLHPQKNQKLLIAAFSKIADIFPEHTLEIYGDGGLYNDLSTQIDTLGLQNRVIIHHSQNDIWESIYKPALFVLTSDYEGMPNALMEAMAYGIPCISTDCRPGGARALINNGENGFIVSCGDEDQLSQTIKLVLENRSIQEKIGNRAKEITITHSEKAIFDKWNTYIENVYKDK